jgi:hypothetical protein
MYVKYPTRQKFKTGDRVITSRKVCGSDGYFSQYTEVVIVNDSNYKIDGSYDICDDAGNTITGVKESDLIVDTIEERNEAVRRKSVSRILNSLAIIAAIAAVVALYHLDYAWLFSVLIK